MESDFACRKEEERMRKSDSVEKDVMVDLSGTVELLHEHLSESLCAQVFQDVRNRERERHWTLHAMARFWTDVIIRGPDSLTQALEECTQGALGWLQVEATPVSFFEKSPALHPRFFATVHERFLDSILPEAKPVFASDLAHLYARFPEVWITDGSKLSAIARRLKVLRNVRSVVLPGALLAFYDLRRGILRHLDYAPDAARAEITCAIEEMACVPAGTLLLADRLFAVPKLFEAVRGRKAWIVARRNRTVNLRRVKQLTRQSYSPLESVPVSTGEYDWEYDGECASTTNCRSRLAKRLGTSPRRAMWVAFGDSSLTSYS